MTQKDKLKFYHGLLITLHTYVWTGNNKKVGELLDAIGRYSYSHTNSNEGDDYKPNEIFKELIESYNKITNADNTNSK